LIHLILPCLGVSLAWYGLIANDLPHTATTSSYSIDGQSAVSFLLKGLTEESAPPAYNQKFFETITLPYGHHNITVSFQGNEQTTPLTLDYLVVQNGTASEGSSISTSSPGSSSTGKDAGSSTSSTGSLTTGKNVGSNMNDTSSKSNVGVIAGGIVGAVGFILLACVLFLCYRRKQRKQQHLTGKDICHNSTPLPATGVEPFLCEGARQYSTTTLLNHGSDLSYPGSYPPYVGLYLFTNLVWNRYQR